MQLSMGIWSTLKVMTTLKSKNLLGMGLQCKSCTSTLYSAVHALHNTHSSAILSESTAYEQNFLQNQPLNKKTKKVATKFISWKTFLHGLWATKLWTVIKVQVLK